MTQINIDDYKSKELIGKYMYVCKNSKDFIYYHIFKVKDVNVKNNKIIYDLSNAFYFSYPKINMKCFCYDDQKTIDITSTDILYELSKEEYETTALVFFKYNGKNRSEVPSKLIQNIDVK